MAELHRRVSGGRCKSRSAIAGLLWVAFAAACSGPELKEDPAGVPGSVVAGQLAPEFAVEDRAGKVHRLSDFRGRVVLVNFWATWCLPCIEEMPSMESVRKEIDETQLTILALSVDDSWEDVDPFVKASGYGLRIVSDFEEKVAKLYGTEKVPETYILDKRGIVVRKVEGAIDWMHPEVLSFLRKLIAA